MRQREFVFFQKEEKSPLEGSELSEEGRGRVQLASQSQQPRIWSGIFFSNILYMPLSLSVHCLFVFLIIVFVVVFGIIVFVK